MNKEEAIKVLIKYLVDGTEPPDFKEALAIAVLEIKKIIQIEEILK